MNTIFIYDLKDEDRSHHILHVMLIVFIFGFIVSIFGILGPWRRSSCLTWTYVVNMVTIILVTAVTWFAFVMNLDEKRYCFQQISYVWKRLLKCEDNLFAYQIMNKCCGYAGEPNFLEDQEAISQSCYDHFNHENQANVLNDDCLNDVVNYYKRTMKSLAIFCLLAFIIEALCLIVAAALALVYERKGDRVARRARHQRQEN
ncbi:uncharacterized protein LOC119684457 [Teleopsis dalmanni]|nr:uncharacterized protein LOC119684457 [Teleopsis dalmanni]